MMCLEGTEKERDQHREEKVMEDGGRGWREGTASSHQKLGEGHGMA